MVTTEPGEICTFCRNVSPDGRFVHTFLEELPIKTADGELHYEGHVRICLGDQDRPGCAIALIHSVGGLTPQDWERNAELHRKVLEAADERERADQRKIAELEAIAALGRPGVKA